MADIKFSQFTNTPTPNANAFFVGYNSTTGINSRTTLTDLITAIGAPSGSGTANFVSKWSGTNTLTNSLIQDDGNAVSVFGINENLLFLDKTQPYSVLLSTDASGIWNSTKLVTIGDVYENYNGTNIVVDIDAQIIKTKNQGSDKGLFLNFANNIYKFGLIDINGIKVELSNTIIGDYDFEDTGTSLSVDRGTEIIKTSSQGADKGLYLDFPNNQYSLGAASIGTTAGLYLNNNGQSDIGDYLSNNNATFFRVDDSNQNISAYFNGSPSGLVLDLGNSEYQFGDSLNNNTNIVIYDTQQIINLNSQRVQYTGQDSATIAAFTFNAAGQLAYDSDLNSFQYYNGSAWAAVAPKTTYMMTGVFTNMFGGDPGGLNKDILDWVGSTPAASHSSALPILQNCRITAAGFKWISSTPIATIAPGDSWTIQVFKMINPLTASTTADGNFTLVGNLNITLTSANSGTTPGVFSSGLDLILNAGDIIRIAGVETGAIGTTTEEAQLTVLFELI